VPLSTREQALVDCAKALLPDNFVARTTDTQLKAYLDLVLTDVNLTTPCTQFTLDTMPLTWDDMICYGATLFATLFLQLRYSLKDFTYSDYGVNLTVDRHARLGATHEKMTTAYYKMVWNAKKCYLMKNVKIQGHGTPRFQSQIGQFLKIVFGQTYNWGSTPNG
jgi:hypothetical protein